MSYEQPLGPHYVRKLGTYCTESVGSPQSSLPVVPKETRSGPGSCRWESPTVKEKGTLPSPCVVPSGSPGLTKTRSGRVVTRPVRLDL